MFSSNPCDPAYSSTDTTNNFSNYGPANCFRPLQQLYKTVYKPVCGNDLLRMNIECICRPAERYKTTNMTYGSFYYDNSLSSTQKNHAINYDKAAFARCYDYNNLNKSGGYQSSDDNGGRGNPIFGGAMDAQESQYWTQPTNDACCPIDCCTSRSYFLPEHCKANNENLNRYNTSGSSNNLPSYSSQQAQPTTKSSNVQVRCV